MGTKKNKNKIVQTMMKKNVILPALAVLALVSCAKVENTVPSPQAQPVAMNFGVYMPQTKAGTAGVMDNTLLQTTGFGVMAYVQAGPYDSATSLPTFMYNQHVTYGTSGWIYSPVKYWPNQLDGNGIDGNGQAAQTVSFFAYAPYVETADGSEGIVSMYAGTTPGDPTLTYKATTDLSKTVDLVWGTSNGDTWTNVDGGDNTVAEGLPYINLQKPSVGTKVNFKFYHALSQLNLTAVGAYNIIGAGGTAKDGVKVTIKEIILTVPGMYDRAVLNLNNTVAKQARWDVTGASEAPMTLTVSGERLNPSIKDLGVMAASLQPVGVTATDSPVIADGRYFTFIPKEGSTTINVKITYYVTTDDSNLADGYSRVENVITKNITLPGGFKAGTKNTIRMVLGLTEVSLSAEVSDWEIGSSTGIDLPKNE